MVLLVTEYIAEYKDWSDALGPAAERRSLACALEVPLAIRQIAVPSLLPGISHQFIHVGDSRIIAGIIILERPLPLITFIPYGAALLAVAYAGVGEKIVHVRIEQLAYHLLVSWFPYVVICKDVTAIVCGVVPRRTRRLDNFPF